MTIVALISVGALITLALWWRFLRIARPGVRPLALPADDPLLLKAARKATQSLDRFRELLLRPHNGAHAKVRFVSNADETEFLWSEVRELRETEIEVLY